MIGSLLLMMFVVVANGASDQMMSGGSIGVDFLNGEVQEFQEEHVVERSQVYGDYDDDDDDEFNRVEGEIQTRRLASQEFTMCPVDISLWRKPYCTCDGHLFCNKCGDGTLCCDHRVCVNKWTETDTPGDRHFVCSGDPTNINEGECQCEEKTCSKGEYCSYDGTCKSSPGLPLCPTGISLWNKAYCTCNGTSNCKKCGDKCCDHRSCSNASLRADRDFLLPPCPTGISLWNKTYCTCNGTLNCKMCGDKCCDHRICANKFSVDDPLENRHFLCGGDETVANEGDCQCGSVNCDDSTGKYCSKDGECKSSPVWPKCIGDETTINEGACQCGEVVCGDSTGKYCSKNGQCKSSPLCPTGISLWDKTYCTCDGTANCNRCGDKCCDHRACSNDSLTVNRHFLCSSDDINEGPCLCGIVTCLAGNHCSKNGQCFVPQTGEVPACPRGISLLDKTYCTCNGTANCNRCGDKCCDHRVCAYKFSDSDTLENRHFLCSGDKKMANEGECQCGESEPGDPGVICSKGEYCSDNACKDAAMIQGGSPGSVALLIFVVIGIALGVVFFVVDRKKKKGKLFEALSEKEVVVGAGKE